MDPTTLETAIRSAAENEDELPKDPSTRHSLLQAARQLVGALEPPDETISQVSILSVRVRNDPVLSFWVHMSVEQNA